VKDIGVDAVRNDLPIRLEIPIEGDRGAVGDGDRRAQHVQSLLEESAAQGVSDGPVEVRVEGSDHRAVRLFDREDRKDRCQRRVDMNDVISSFPQHSPQFAPKIPTERDSRLRSVGVDRLAPADPNDVRLGFRPRNVGRNDVHMVPTPARLASEKVHVLADTPEVGIVVLRDQRNPE